MLPHSRRAELLSQDMILGHLEWPKKVVGIGHAICYVQSATVHEFFDNLNRSTPMKSFDRRRIKLRFNGNLAKPYTCCPKPRGEVLSSAHLPKKSPNLAARDSPAILPGRRQRPVNIREYPRQILQVAELLSE
jgi:hypothetical protein